MKPTPGRTDHSLLLLLAAVFVFHSPFTSWWSKLALPWYTIFVLWFLLIALVAINHRRNSADEENNGGD